MGKSLSKRPVIGAKAPSISLPSDSGERVTLSGFKGKTVVLYFYPKDLTSGCTQQAHDFEKALSKFRKKGAVILGVSRDDVARHGKFKEKEGLSLTLLSDEEGKASEAYGVWVEKSMYGRKYMGIERSTFVIGPDGKIQAEFRKVKVPGHIEEVLKAIS